VPLPLWVLGQLQKSNAAPGSQSGATAALEGRPVPCPVWFFSRFAEALKKNRAN